MLNLSSYPIYCSIFSVMTVSLPKRQEAQFYNEVAGSV